MKILRTPYLLAAVCLFSLLMARPSQGQLGIAAGANFDNLGDVEEQDVQASFENATGFHVGVFYDMAVGPLAIRPGLFYMDVGDMQANFEEGTVDPNFDGSFDASLLEVPIDARLRLAALPLIKPYLLGGPSFRLVTSESDDFGDSASDFSMAANVGIGLEIGLPTSTLRLFPEVRYAFGLSRFAEDFQVQGQGVTVEDSARLNSWMLRLGLAF